MRSLLFPVGFLWLLPQLFGNVGIYVAIPLAEMCTLVVASLIFAASRKHFADRKAHHGPERAWHGAEKICSRRIVREERSGTRVAAVARQPVVSYAMRPDKLVLKRTLLVMLHGCSLNRVTEKR